MHWPFTLARLQTWPARSVRAASLTATADGVHLLAPAGKPCYSRASRLSGARPRDLRAICGDRYAAQDAPETATDNQCAGEFHHCTACWPAAKVLCHVALTSTRLWTMLVAEGMTGLPSGVAGQVVWTR